MILCRSILLIGKLDERNAYDGIEFKICSSYWVARASEKSYQGVIYS